MSLVGSLEDLGLGDILQIITLSRKSGILALRSDSGEGRIRFRDGLVCGAAVKGKTPDLRGLVVESGGMEAADFEAARKTARERGVPLSEAVSEALGAERFEGLRRECVERAVLEMFAWNTGEFSFEVGEDDAGDEFEVVLEAGVNAQYLAMEGTRRSDEESRAPEADPDDVSSFADLAEEMAAEEEGASDEEPEAVVDAEGPEEAAEEAVVEPEDGPGDAYEAVALTTAERFGGDDEAGAAPRAASATEEAVARALELALAEEAETVGAAEAEAALGARPEAPPSPGPLPPVVVVDPDLAVLEWAKGALKDRFARIHIFQKAELAVQRLRQYAARGDVPAVLVAPSLPVDRTSGVADVTEWVARQKRQTPRQVVLWLGPGSEPVEVGPADGVVLRPEDHELADRRAQAVRSKRADALRAGVLEALGEETGAGESGVGGRVAAALRRLEDPDTRGEVLNVVLGLAAEHFGRVALFMVREGRAQGLAQAGLERAGGPDDAGIRDVTMAVEESSWLRAVVESGRPVRAPADGPGDHELAARFGLSAPPEAWLGPVVTGDQVVAILYGDNLPGGDSIPETEGLEAVLAKAGSVLEQAAQERARAGSAS